MNSHSRTYNSIRNISYGLIITVINTLVSFITRYFLVKSLGVEVLGVNGLFSEIIEMLSLAELGVGMAIVYSLYKPIYENDYKKINQLMSLYKETYNIIAIVSLCLGLIILPFVHYLINDVDYPLSFIRIVFMLFVINTASSYLFSYKTALLNADQKQYIVSLRSALVKLVMTVIIIIALMAFQNYIMYLCLLVGQSVTTNIILARYVDRNYPFLDYREKLNVEDKHEVLGNVRNIFIKRVSGVITSSTDNVLISTLVSTIQVGYYSNYVMVFKVVRTLRQQLTNGIAASIGNLSVTEKPEKCISVLRNLTFMYYAFASIMASGLLAIASPFISLIFGKDYVMSNTIIYVAIFNLFLDICADPLWQYLEVSGLFKQDRNIAILGSSINLIVSIVLGYRMGIVGIFLGTVCTQVIQIFFKTKLIFEKKFEKMPYHYLLMWLKLVLGFILALAVQMLMIQEIYIVNPVFTFIIKGIVAGFIGLGIPCMLFFKSHELYFCKNFIREILIKIKK